MDETLDGGVLVVAVTGRIGHVSAGLLQRSLEDRIAAGARRLAIDLDGVDSNSSAGLLALAALARRLGRVDGRLMLCAMTEPARLVLQLAGWSERFEIEESRSAAVRRLGSSS